MQVLIIHGLGRTPLSLLGLERHLQRSGHVTEQFSYFAFAETFDDITTRLQNRLKILANQGAYSVVAHSLGGLLVRVALSHLYAPLPAHFVMLGTPNKPPRLAAQAWKFFPFRWFTGQCGLNLTRPDFFHRLPPIPVPHTIVAGTIGPTGPWSPFGVDPNDGVVAVQETYPSPQTPIIQLPVWHTFMMNDARVQAAVAQAIQRNSPRPND